MSSRFDDLAEAFLQDELYLKNWSSRTLGTSEGRPSEFAYSPRADDDRTASATLPESALLK